MSLLEASKTALKLLQRDRDEFVIAAMRVNGGTLSESSAKIRDVYDGYLNSLLYAVEAVEKPVAWCVFDDIGLPVYSAADERACHERINDEINEYDNTEAAKWRVRPVALHPSAKSLEESSASSKR